ncbi:MAG: dipeptide epimerase [Candidatus Thermoplasmatota archaeon]
MRIIDIVSYPINIPLKKPFVIASGSTKSYSGVLIEIITNERIRGIGESAPTKITNEDQKSVIEDIEKAKKRLIGKEPREIEKLLYELPKIGKSAKAGIDIALHDILGKSCKLPLKYIFGGYRDKIETSVTIGICSLENTLKEAKRLIDIGVKIIKLKIGISPKEDLEKVKEIRNCIGYEPKLRLDANQGYSVAKAIETLKKMEGYDIEFVEQPVNLRNIRGMREVRKKVDIPIMADESMHNIDDLMKIISYDAAELLNIKLMKVGGLRTAMKISNIAEANGIKCMLGCMIETKVGITAATHLACGLKNIEYADLDGNLELIYDCVDGGVELKNGRNVLPDLPGLGLKKRFD